MDKYIAEFVINLGEFKLALDLLGNSKTTSGELHTHAMALYIELANSYRKYERARKSVGRARRAARKNIKGNELQQTPKKNTLAGGSSYDPDALSKKIARLGKYVGGWAARIAEFYKSQNTELETQANVS